MEFDLKKWAQEELRIAIETEEKSQGENSEKDTKRANDILKALETAEGCYEVILDSRAPRSLVSQMLSQLMNGQPLSPIYDTDDIWELDENQPEYGIKYVCKRLPTLTKLVTKDEGGEEKVEYNDLGRYYCFDLAHSNRPFTGGLGGAVLNALEPITFPYYPIGKYSIFTERLRAYQDISEDDVDTIGILRIRYPTSQIFTVEKYFKLTPDKEKWVETDRADYQARRRKAHDISYKAYKKKMDQEGANGE